MRQLERRFKDAAGVSPKSMARWIRFSDAQERIELDPGTSLAALACELGYADQAHFTHIAARAHPTLPRFFSRWLPRFSRAEWLWGLACVVFRRIFRHRFWGRPRDEEDRAGTWRRRFIMGERGHVLHIQDSGGTKLLGRAPVRCAWLGVGKRWTSFVPVCNEEVDDVVFAASLGADVAHVWFDDDVGVTVRITTQSGFLGELSVPLGEGEARARDQDARFLEALVERKLLTKTAAKSLLVRLGSKLQERDAWIAGHGLEALFGFPHVVPIPPGADQTLLKEIAPDASLVIPVATRAMAAPTGESERKASHEWSPEERVIVDLHVHYWTHVWSMNSWTLYNRYKKHLPANARRDVDQLGNAVDLGDDALIRELVEHILARVWAADDWGALIRSPKVDDCGTDEEVARVWLQMTGRA